MHGLENFFNFFNKTLFVTFTNKYTVSHSLRTCSAVTPSRRVPACFEPDDFGGSLYAIAAILGFFHLSSSCGGCCPGPDAWHGRRHRQRGGTEPDLSLRQYFVS